MTQRKAVAEREEELRNLPVQFDDDGTVRVPVTYSQLLRECERLKAENKFMRGQLDSVYGSGSGCES